MKTQLSDLIGQRILVGQKQQGYSPSSDIKEIKILEVSPSGTYVKVMDGHGNKYWKLSVDITPIEVLATVEKHPVVNKVETDALDIKNKLSYVLAEDLIKGRLYDIRVLTNTVLKTSDLYRAATFHIIKREGGENEPYNAIFYLPDGKEIFIDIDFINVSYFITLS